VEEIHRGVPKHFLDACERHIPFSKEGLHSQLERREEVYKEPEGIV